MINKFYLLCRVSMVLTAIVTAPRLIKSRTPSNFVIQKQNSDFRLSASIKNVKGTEHILSKEGNT